MRRAPLALLLGTALVLAFGSPLAYAQSTASGSTIVVDPSATPLLTDTPSNVSQTIRVGDHPTPLELGPATTGALAVITGELPTGLTLNPDGTWAGTAGETGTFTITLCAPDPVCAAHGPADFTLVVLSRQQALPRTGGAFTVQLLVLGAALVALGIGLRSTATTRLR